MQPRSFSIQLYILLCKSQYIIVTHISYHTPNHLPHFPNIFLPAAHASCVWRNVHSMTPLGGSRDRLYSGTPEMSGTRGSTMNFRGTAKELLTFVIVSIFRTPLRVLPAGRTSYLIRIGKRTKILNHHRRDEICGLCQIVIYWTGTSTEIIYSPLCLTHFILCSFDF